MKRREFMKVAGFGLTGLVGLERLVKAMSGEPDQAQEAIEPIACAASATSGHVEVVCQPENRNVTCTGVNPSGPGFYCDNYVCNANFKCEDFTCYEKGIGDFNCNNGFQCPTNKRAQFHCQGGDFITDQFNCYAYFTCNPGGSDERFFCNDFHCAEGNFTCEGIYQARLTPK